MKLSIFWPDMLHYHASRLKALYSLASSLNHTIYTYSFSDKSNYMTVPSYNHLIENKLIKISPRSERDNVNSQYFKNEISKRLETDNPDVVAIAGYYFGVSRTALGWCRYNNKSAVLLYTSQEIDKKRYWWKEVVKKQLVSYYDAALVGGIPHIEYLIKLGMPKNRIFTKCEVVDNDFWSINSIIRKESETELNTKYNLPNNFFLTVGRLIPEKNYARMLTTYSRYSKYKCTWDLVIVGDGELRNELRNLCTKLNITNNVHFLGSMNADDLAQIYGLASVFILPSINEPWGLVVNEAMACGLPVIVSNRCGCSSDLIIEGNTGFLFDPYDEESLINNMLMFSTNKIDYRKMGENAKQHIQQYSTEAFAQNLFKAAIIAMAYSKVRKWNIWPPPKLWL